MESCVHPSVTMHARILEVRCGDLLVCDLQTNQEVVVHTPNSCRFRTGDHICIHYNGAMTMSIPPQISADRICCVPGC